jgi:hypothetical protein
MPILLDPGPSRRGWHRLQTFLECPQKYAWEYLRPSGGEKPVPKDGPLVIGSLTHVGIAHHYARLRETQHGRDSNIYHEPSTAIALLAEKNGWHQQDVEHVQDLVIDYIAHWSGREQWRVLYVEEVFEARYPFVKGPIRRKVRDERGVWTGEWREEEDALLTARVDLAIEMAGKVYFVDHKTTGRIDVKHPKFYTMSGQLINYRWLGTMAFGEKFGGVLLNMVQTQGGRKFQRPPLEPAPALFNKFPQTIEDAERRIAQLEDEDRAVSAWPAATNELTCFHRYGACSHLERCKWGLL